MSPLDCNALLGFVPSDETSKRGEHATNNFHDQVRAARPARATSLALVEFSFRQRSDITVELTRARASDNFELEKHLKKHAIAPRVQRIVMSPQFVTRHANIIR